MHQLRTRIQSTQGISARLMDMAETQETPQGIQFLVAASESGGGLCKYSWHEGTAQGLAPGSSDQGQVVSGSLLPLVCFFLNKKNLGGLAGRCTKSGSGDEARCVFCVG